VCALQQYSTYTPPRDDYTEAYRASRGTPPPPNMQVAPYRDAYDDRRSSAGYSEPPSHRHSHEHRSSNAGYYDEPARPHSRGEGHRGSVGGEKGPRHGSSASHHDGVKDIGASLLGAAVGGFAGHEVGHGGVATLIGAVAGGVAGHKLEGRHEKHKEERKRKEGEVAEKRHPEGPYGYAEGRRPRRRSSRSRGGRSESSGSETDSSYERRHHHRH
jgi:hypothetical protein